MARCRRAPGWIRCAADQNCTREPAFGEAQPGKIERAIKGFDNPTDAGREMIKPTCIPGTSYLLKKCSFLCFVNCIRP